MDIVLKAREFASKAHSNQIRKSESDKPYIVHPVAVANILKKYGYDEAVQAAGFLHDVVEDTPYSLSDIELEFGDDIASLVKGASEEDKTLSWEERKQHTIDTIKDLDLRHKVLIAADKINNLEDMYLLFEKKGKHDFSAFRRGEEQQKWYYEGVYQSLITNEDANLDIFLRLKQAIDKVFNYQEDLFLKDKIFINHEDYYNRLKVLNAYKEELIKLKELIQITKPYIIEFSGTPRTGKTTTINNLYDFFKKGGFKVSIVEEFTTSKYYKEELYPKELASLNKGDLNLRVAEYVYEQLLDISKSDKDIVIIDRSLNDRQIWNYRRLKSGDLDYERYIDARDKYKNASHELIDYLVITYADALVSLKRDYLTSLALEKRNFLNTENINNFNSALMDIKPLLEECVDGVSLIDTSNMDLNDVSYEACDSILKDMRKTYIKEIKKQYK
ncbi:MAG: HD domain-containing protein [Bacilli bacterium]|nr:HD domain-containing protein [Bacilli bacterium]